jgi:hypothetical protein
MTTTQKIGLLLIIGALGVLLPYLLLGFYFRYPMVLRLPAGEILEAFSQGGATLIVIWWAFALLGVPLLLACILMGRLYGQGSSLMSLAKSFGVFGLLLQMIGLLRWVLVVPVLAESYVEGNMMQKEMAALVFQVVHQYGGVILGEHLGQLFTIAWTVLLAYCLSQEKRLPAWTSLLAYIASGIYLCAQAELVATVVPTFPVWRQAGLIGSTLWLLWLMVVGFYFLRPSKALALQNHSFSLQKQK